MSDHSSSPILSKRTARSLITVGVVAIILIALFGIFTLYVTIAHAPSRATTQVPSPMMYTSATYGYSFAYPAQYTIDAYTPEYVSVGTTTTDGFDAVAEANVLTAEASDTVSSFTDFAHKQAELTCDADGPDSSISCPKVSRSLTFTSASGLVGEEFYLIQDTKSVAAGTVAETERGPYFSFTISGDVPNVPYRLLLVRPPSATEPDQILNGVIRGIAQSLTIGTTSR